MAKTTFGKKLRECREDKGLSQQELAKILKTSHSVIGRYERDEMSPSIDAVKKMAAILDTTVGYLLGESTVFIPAKLTPLFRGKLTPFKGPVSGRVKELE